METVNVLHLDMAPSIDGPNEVEFDINQFTSIEVKDVTAVAPSLPTAPAVVAPDAVERMSIEELKAICAAATTTLPSNQQQQKPTRSETQQPLTFAMASKMSHTSSSSSPPLDDQNEEHEWICKLTSSMAEASEATRSSDTAPPPPMMAIGTTPNIETSIRAPHTSSSTAQEIMAQFDVSRHRTQNSSDDDHGDSCRAAFMDVLSRYGKKP